MLEYRNNGLTWANVDPGSTPAAGGFRTWSLATPAALASAFPGYTSAAEVQALTAQITAIQTQIDALDGGTQARSVRAALLAILPAGNADLARLQALEASIVPCGRRSLRSRPSSRQPRRRRPPRRRHE